MLFLLRTLPPLVSFCSKQPLYASLPLYRTFSRCRTPTTLYQKRIFSVYAAPNAPSPAEILVTDANLAKDSLQWTSRTGYCGELSADDVGKRVRLCGWVALHRSHGGLTFLDLRDHTGIVQVATLPHKFPVAHSIANGLRLEYVIAVEGVVRSRPRESFNSKMNTGMIEVAVEHIQVLNSVRSKLPFSVTAADDAKENVKEEIRLRYRCLDLRRQQMNFNLSLRHKVVKFIRRYLEDVHGFMEIETPILSRSTPEGARDYLVPSRVQMAFMPWCA